MAQKTFNTSYGEAIVRNAMFESEHSHDLFEGIEIKIGSDIIEIAEYYDVEEMTEEDVQCYVSLHYEWERLVKISKNN